MATALPTPVPAPVTTAIFVCAMAEFLLIRQRYQHCPGTEAMR
jgi:hypothetical protein